MIKIPERKRKSNQKRSVSKVRSNGSWKRNGCNYDGPQPKGKRHIKLRKIRKIRHFNQTKALPNVLIGALL